MRGYGWIIDACVRKGRCSEGAPPASPRASSANAKWCAPQYREAEELIRGNRQR